MDAFALPWCLEYDLFTERSPLCRSTTADWAAWVSPDGVDERVLLLGAAAYWSFVWDDDSTLGGLVDHAALANAAGRLARVADFPEATALSGDSKHVRFLRDFMLRVRRDSTPGQFQLFADGLNRYVLSTVWHNGQASAHRPPTLGEYLDMRSADACDTWAPGSIAWIDDFELTPTDLTDPMVVVAFRVAAATLGLSNDLISFNHERNDTHKANAVDVVTRNDGCDVEAAIAKVAAAHDQCMTLFTVACDRIARTGTQAQQRFARGLAAWSRGNAEWANQTARYHRDIVDPDSGSTVDLPPSVIQLHDSTPIASYNDRPIVDGTEWWWDVLGI